METIKNRIDKYIDMVNDRLSHLFKKPDEIYHPLYESMRYSLLAGGKRIRPLLSFAACELLGIDHMKCLNYVCAIEMIHTYSLIHDDLPAMDDDDFRRGIPTNHRRFGEDIAILAGDGLLNMAAILLNEEVINSNDIKNALKASRYILIAAGPDGMIAGQTVDIKNMGENISFEDLEFMHSLKTGALIRASICFPAILENKQEEFMILERAAMAIGLAFQIKDDILDVEGDFVYLGKEVGKDKDKNKATYVSYIGLENAKKLLKEETTKAISEINRFGNNGELLKYLIGIISSRNN